MNSSQPISQELSSPLPLNGELTEAGAGASISRPGLPEPQETYRRLRGAGGVSLLVGLLSPFLVLATETANRILLAIVILDIPIQLGHRFFHRENDSDVGSLVGLSVSATTIALAGLYSSWFIRTMGNRNHGRRSALLFDWSLFFYFTITSLSLLVAQDVTLSIFEVCLLAEACLVYFYVANAVRTRQDVLFIVKFLMIGCLLESLIIIFMRIAVTPSTNWDFPIHIIAEFVGRSGLMRVGGTIGVPNIAGAYLSILLALAISLQFTNIGHTYKQLAAAVIGLGTVAIIFTFSRGGWIALVLAVIVICFTISRHRGFSLKAPIAILAVLALLYVPFHSVISTRLFGNDNGSAEARVPLDRLAFRIIQANPVLGVGVDNFTVVMNRYVTSEFRNGWLFAVHNRYLLILAETGIGGLLAYLAFLLGTLRKAWLCWRKNDPLLSPIALGLAAGITGHMVHMTVDLFRGRPIQQLLWLVAGLITAMHRMCAPAPCADSPSRFK